jgi:hypothetical protein
VTVDQVPLSPIMTPTAHAPPWSTFPVLKHPPDQAHLDVLYCLAAAARWLHRFDDKVPSIKDILARMLAVLPPKLPKGELREKDIRQADDLCGLAVYRFGQTAGWNDLVDPTTPVDTVMITSVMGLPVPHLQEPPDGYRFVLVLGVPDKQRRFLVADPHPETPGQYRVPVDDFELEWEAPATEGANPKALAVWRPGPTPMR